MFATDEYGNERKQGHCASVAALVIALDECGVVPRHRYCDALTRLWQEMPDDEAVGEAGAVIERVLELLGRDGGPAAPCAETEQKRENGRKSVDPADNSTLAGLPPAFLKGLLRF